MKAVFGILLATCLLAGPTGASTSAIAQGYENKDAIAKAAEAARTLRFDELIRMFRGRSWIWDDGAGYFQKSDQRFFAWVGTGDEASYAEGKWFIADRGRVCFRATWYALSGAASALTCFTHRIDDNAIYQRRLPNGRWYIFSHLPPRKDDAIQKLKLGDHVSGAFERTRRYLTGRLHR